MSKVETNNIKIVSEIRVNRETCQFHGVAGWSAGYMRDDTYESGFIQIFGNLQNGYMHFNDNGHHRMVYLGRGRTMKVLYTLGYGKFKDIEVTFDELFDALESIRRVEYV